MTKIKTLDTHLTNMIAAGEVVERPSGIVKELIENALDAKAMSITIKIEEGGMRRIEVIDNGEGIHKDDIPLAFMRHSTSKIHHEEDLSRILSFGFRGEALPSIASVSFVELTSNDGSGSYRYTVDNGSPGNLLAFPRNPGTTVTVSDLFLKTPARLKFIKNTRYEASLILNIIQKFAMSHPEVAFTYFNEERLSFKTYGNNQAKDVFHQIYGAAFAKELRSFAKKSYDFEVEGLCVLPVFNRAHKNDIWITMNGRMIRYPKIVNRVIEAYRHYLPHNRYPIVILDIKTDPHLVDVNVHPSKWEIRLSKEESVLSLVEAAIEECLQVKIEAPKVQRPSYVPTEKVQFDFNQEIKEEVNKPLFVWEEPVINIEEPIKENIVAQDSVSEVNFPELKVLSQFGMKYILCEASDALYIIDQHAAMERIRYEYYREKLLGQAQSIQGLLVPVVFEGRGGIVGLLDKLNEKLASFHIHFDSLDETSLVVREIPTWLKQEEANEFLNTILDDFSSDKNIREEEFRRKTLATLACHSSVRFNMYLSMIEMEKLVDDLSQCKEPYHCPHGRPTMIQITHKALIKDFMR